MSCFDGMLHYAYNFSDNCKVVCVVAQMQWLMRDAVLFRDINNHRVAWVRRVYSLAYLPGCTRWLWSRSEVCRCGSWHTSNCLVCWVTIVSTADSNGGWLEEEDRTTAWLRMSETCCCCWCDDLLYEYTPSMLRCPVHSIVSCSSMPVLEQSSSAVGSQRVICLGTSYVHISATTCNSLLWPIGSHENQQLDLGC